MRQEKNPEYRCAGIRSVVHTGAWVARCKITD